MIVRIQARAPRRKATPMPQRAATTPKNNGTRIDTTRPQAIVSPDPGAADVGRIELGRMGKRYRPGRAVEAEQQRSGEVKRNTTRYERDAPDRDESERRAVRAGCSRPRRE